MTDQAPNYIIPDKTYQCPFKNESQFQSAAFQCFHNEFIRLRGQCFHIKNEGEKADLLRMQDAARGVLPGVPDMPIMHKGITYYAELKMPGKTTTPAQDKLHERWKKTMPAEMMAILYPFGDDGLHNIRLFANWILSEPFKLVKS